MKKKNKNIGKTNWSKVNSLTESQLITAAKSDPDALPLTPAQLKKFKQVHSSNKTNIKTVILPTC